MSGKARRLATVVAGMAAAGAMAAAATPASAELTLPFHNWAVWGSLTPKKLGEPVVLPKGSTFNGSAHITKLSETEIEGTISGKIFVPPFHAKLKLVGLIPTEVGLTFTQVGEALGTLETGPPGACAHARLSGVCTTISVDTKAIIGIETAGVLGIEVPTHCETSEPVNILLRKTLTLGELSESHFSGTVTIPPVKCEGLQGIVLGALLTELMSGPENPYALNLGAHEPTAPEVTTRPAVSITQDSALLRGIAVPGGEPITDCDFEYGTSTSYGTSVPCSFRAGNAVVVTAPASGLSEATTYHYRLVATNSLGTSDGADQEVTTLAAAGAPEYGRCAAQKGGEYAEAGCETKPAKVKRGSFEWASGPLPSCVAQKKGNYTDPACTVSANKPGKGSYEKTSGGSFTSTSASVTLEAATLGGANGSTVTCAASTGSGAVSSARAGSERITFTGCESAGRQCASEGSNGTPSGQPGTIVTNLLATRLLGPLPGGKVWTQFVSSEHVPYVAEFGCGGQRFRIRGSVAGDQSGNVGAMSATSTTKFVSEPEETTEESEQALLVELSSNGGESWSAPAYSNLLTTLTNTTGSPTEIRR